MNEISPSDFKESIGMTSYSYTTAQVRRLAELLKCNSNSIRAALGIMLSEKSIDPNMSASEVVGVWVSMAEDILNCTDKFSWQRYHSDNLKRIKREMFREFSGKQHPDLVEAEEWEFTGIYLKSKPLCLSVPEETLKANYKLAQEDLREKIKAYKSENKISIECLDLGYYCTGNSCVSEDGDLGYFWALFRPASIQVERVAP